MSKRKSQHFHFVVHCATCIHVYCAPIAISEQYQYYDNYYIHFYHLLVLQNLTDLIICLFFYSSSYLIYRKMRSSSANVSFSTSQERARRRRNRNITLVLIGIIFLFLVCHIGEVAISIYELVGLLDEERKPFPKWANNIVIVNHLLIVINSSLNFVIYCKDVVFR